MAYERAQRLWPWALVMISALVLTALGAKHRRLSREFLDHRREDSRLQSGAYVPVFQGTSVAGDSVLLGAPAPGKRQVVAVLTSTCPYCLASLPAWKRLDSRLQDAGVLDPLPGLIAVTPEPLERVAGYGEKNEIGFPIVPFPTRRLASLYQANVVPQTVVIDEDGRVIFARHGVVNTDAAVDSIVAAVLAPRASVTTATDIDSGASNAAVLGGIVQ